MRHIIIKRNLQLRKKTFPQVVNLSATYGIYCNLSYKNTEETDNITVRNNFTQLSSKFCMEIATQIKEFIAIE